ncbi:tyrosyl-DNA phosphodiesterase I, partial [Gigaspora rosea]
NILLVHPPLPNAPFGCFHAKLMLLFFDGWMRVVVASGNLIPYDWETNENVIFVQDFPIVQATGSNIGNLHPFAQDIKDFILAIGLKNHIVNKLSQYDFSRAKAKLVASIPGAYKGVENIKKYGHGRLCKVVQEVCGQNENIILECQTSTLGGLTADFLHEFYRSASGIDPLEISKPRTKKSQGVETPLPQMTMVYPSNRTVSSSKYSKAAGAALFFGKSNYEKHTFPKEIIRQSVEHCVYAYLLSKKMKQMHSLTCIYSTLGKISTSRETKGPQLRINNWELGVFFPIRGSENDQGDWFTENGVPVPYQRPPRRYDLNDTPWVSLEFCI